MPTAAELAAMGPGGAGAEEFVQRYLGVPEGYAAQRPTYAPGRPTGRPMAGDVRQVDLRNQGPTMVAPRYTEANLYEPEGMSPEDIARLQQTLDRTGLFVKGQKYVLGRWDDVSIDAYQRLLEFANRGGYDERQALQRMGELTPDEYDELYGKGAYARSSSRRVGQVVGGTPEDVPRGTVNQRMSEDDLRYLANRTARKSLGRSLSDDELSRVSGAYSAMLNQATQREAAAIGQAEAGANVTYASATSPEVFAEQQAQKLDPTAFEARRQVGALRAIGSMLGELGGG